LDCCGSLAKSFGCWSQLKVAAKMMCCCVESGLLQNHQMKLRERGMSELLCVMQIRADSSTGMQMMLWKAVFLAESNQLVAGVKA
jgi:hypothetical protein